MSRLYWRRSPGPGSATDSMRGESMGGSWWMKSLQRTDVAFAFGPMWVTCHLQLDLPSLRQSAATSRLYALFERLPIR